MDSNVHAGDYFNPSLVSILPDGFFTSKTIRSGIFGGAAMKDPNLPKSGREAIGREIMKEQIREEILAREMVERRILEEEVRREIEMERIMEIRRLKMERRAESSGMLVHGDRQTQTFFPPWIEAGITTFTRHGKDDAAFAFRERSLPHLLQRNGMTAMPQSALQHELEKHSLSNEKNKPSNIRLSGTKRKVQDEYLIPEKVWGCALCEVTSSSEEALKEHLQGKKHKVKEAILSSNKKTAPSQSKPNATLHPEGTSDGGSTKKQNKFFCSLCRVKCNSSLMMEYHLSGKKHRKLTELKKVNSSFKTEAVIPVANEKPETVKEDLVKCEALKGR